MKDQSKIDRIKDHFVFFSCSYGIIFDRETLKMFPVENRIALLFEMSIKKIDIIDVEDVLFLYSFLEKLHIQNMPNPLDGITSNLDFNSPKFQILPKRHLRKLSINVSNDCNLSCLYCYANAGLYKKNKPSLLSPDKAQLYVKYFCNYFDLIEVVQFIGGEPSMNPNTIEIIITTFYKLFKEKKIIKLPHFTLITNGFFFNKKFIDICRQMNISITISLDGPEIIHDKARKCLNGKGTYRFIRSNIDVAKNNNINVAFEATFSRIHIENDMNLIDLVEWFHKEFDVSILHAPPISFHEELSISKERMIEEYSSVTRWGIDNLLRKKKYLLHSFTARILHSLEKRNKNKYICGAGTALLSLSGNGDLFPCWMFTDSLPDKLGNVTDENYMIKDNFINVIDRIKETSLEKHYLCQSCFAKNICFGCKARDWHGTKDIYRKVDCEYTKAMIETTIVSLFS